MTLLESNCQVMVDTQPIYWIDELIELESTFGICKLLVPSNNLFLRAFC